MKIPLALLQRAAALRPRTLDLGTLEESFQAMAGGQRVYENRDCASPPDYTEALRLYNQAFGMSDEE